MRLSLVVLLMPLAFFPACAAEQEPEKAPEAAYQADWDSLAQHEAAPEWFRDAKFGIYFHWGVYSVPAFEGEWYPRWMHFKETSTYQHHLEKYGDPAEFGYHDFVPQFSAEHFDAAQWADLFLKAGAKFAGLVAEHHDGFSMWGSKVTPWNALDKGPRRDISGELAEAFRARDLKFLATFHHARNLQRYSDQPQEKDRTDVPARNRFSLSHYPFIDGWPPTSEDPEFRMLYGYIPESQWLEEVWLGKLVEFVENYQPDIVWFDSWLDQIPENYQKRFSAYYLNRASKAGKEVVIVRKQDDLPLTYTIDDLEKSRKNRLEEEPWMTDETVSNGSWCYTEGLTIKDAKDVLHVLIDITSKNGVLLLNISPMANGVIPENQQDVLLAIGSWLEQYGEAIYGTRPWYTYGEGPTVEPEGHFRNHEAFLKLKYANKDVRYTTKGKTLYAITLGVPEAEPILMESFAKDRLPTPMEISKLGVLGSDEEIEWELTDEGLVITAPADVANEVAVVFKIQTL